MGELKYTLDEEEYIKYKLLLDSFDNEIARLRKEFEPDIRTILIILLGLGISLAIGLTIGLSMNVPSCY